MRLAPRGIRLVFGLGPRTGEFDVFLCAFVHSDQGKGEGAVPEAVGIVGGSSHKALRIQSRGP